MTKYAKCGVCGYTVAIPDEKVAGDYVCPVDKIPLIAATEADHYNNKIHAEGSDFFVGPPGVTIVHNLDLTNYTPHIIPTEDTLGAVGEIWTTGIAANSFVVHNSGGGVTAFTWVIHNRT